jgi:hypoxanthine-DNA glycosylase
MPKIASNIENLLLGFPPVINKTTHTLILGSFPGQASLQAQQYYAFPQNQFWRLLSRVLDEDLATMAYPVRLEHLLAHGIGIWDVFEACLRQGSLDSAIRQGEINDFRALQQASPGLRRLCFNVKTAGKIDLHLSQLGYQTLHLPSSSPAYAQMRFDEKLLHWQQIKSKTT